MRAPESADSGSSLPAHSVAPSAVARIGWREWVALPELGIAAIRVKIDSGARSSALHVDDSEVFEDGGVEWVRFSLRPAPQSARVECQARVLERREVTDSGGNRNLRIFIRSTLALGGVAYPIEVNLTNRRDMLFPMLLGRTALAGRWVVDPMHSFLLGRPGRSAGTPG